MSMNDYIPEQFVPLFSNEAFQDAFKGYLKFLVHEDIEFRAEIKTIVNEELDNSFESRLIMSELRPIKRIAELEEVTGIEVDDDEEREPNIPDRIQDLEYKISNFEFRPTVSPDIAKTPDTDTEKRAVCLVNALEASEKDYFSARDIMEFLTCKLPDYCKLDDSIKNVRKVKQDVVRKAAEMFSNVRINKKTTGHKDVRLVLVS